MTVMSKLDMIDHGDIYDWTVIPEDDLSIEEQFNRDFNIQRGYDVLDFINAVCEQYQYSLEDAKKIEQILHLYVPIHLKTRREIAQWLIQYMA